MIRVRMVVLSDYRIGRWSALSETIADCSPNSFPIVGLFAIVE